MKPLLFVLSATLAIAVSFGIARYGFGLFLPDVAASFSLSTFELGLISSGAYLGYFTSSVAAMLWTSRVGARAILAAGMLLATASMALIAVAPSSWVVILGFVLAGASPGFVFSPLSEAIAAAYDTKDHGPVFSTVNAGEGMGAVLSAVTFLFLTTWQTAWGLFAGLAAIGFVLVLLTTPAKPSGRARPAVVPRLDWLIRRDARPLLLGSFVLGVTTTVFWTFAGGLVAERSVEVNSVEIELRSLLWLTLGVAGMAGVIAAPLLRRYGLAITYAVSVLATASALALSGAANTSTGAVLLCGALFGLAYIMATSQVGTWAMSVYIERPSSGFGLTFQVFAMGAVTGPAIAGAASQAVGLGATFIGAGLLTLCLLLFLPQPRKDAAR